MYILLLCSEPWIRIIFKSNLCIGWCLSSPDWSDPTLVYFEIKTKNFIAIFWDFLIQFSFFTQLQKKKKKKIKHFKIKCLFRFQRLGHLRVSKDCSAHQDFSKTRSNQTARLSDCHLCGVFIYSNVDSHWSWRKQRCETEVKVFNRRVPGERPSGCGLDAPGRVREDPGRPPTNSPT